MSAFSANSQMVSLHIGVSYVDKSHYGSSLSALPCCKADATAMRDLTTLLGYNQVELLLNESATAENVKNQLNTYADQLKAGDFLLVTYSGHGGQLPQLIEMDDILEANKQDETWCLYDRQMIDNELPFIWARFKKDVTIVVMLDSCHSGGALKEKIEESFVQTKALGTEGMSEVLTKGANITNYRSLQSEFVNPPTEIVADMLQLTACEADELALAGPFMSKYTRMLLHTLSKKEIASYKKLGKSLKKVHAKLREVKGDQQTPVYNARPFGKKAKGFSKRPPFLREGQSYSKKLRSEIKKLLSWVKEDINEVVEETHSGLILDASHIDSKMIPEGWQGISSSSDKTASDNGKSDFYWSSRTTKKGSGNAWDNAYAVYEDLNNQGLSTFIEPAFYESIKDTKAYQFLNKSGHGFLNNWPQPEGEKHPFKWYQEDDYSQLEKARDLVGVNLNREESGVRIAHIDTGYRPDHNSTKSMRIIGPKSMIPGEETNPAIDVLKSERKGNGHLINWEAIQRTAENDYHGMATLAILAGGKVLKEESYGDFAGTLGGTPFAEIVPIRISETVALSGLMFNINEFVKAVKYAIEMDCRVISMSMAGSPSRSWAKVINEAYEAGIVVVTAAGNSWRSGFRKVLPKKILYPARFERVIAATGASFGKQPYVFAANPLAKTAGGEQMQGNYGPPQAMNYALAAFTPNVPWAYFDDKGNSQYIQTGGGTSSATPQIAAAAGLYIAFHRDEMQRKYGNPNWMWTEATRQALFQSADKSHPEYKTYFGNGTLCAYEALRHAVPDPDELTPAPQARIFSQFTSFWKLLLGKGNRGANAEDPLAEMVELETLQLIHKDPKLADLAAQIEDETQAISDQELKKIFEKVQESPYASEFLKQLK